MFVVSFFQFPKSNLSGDKLIQCECQAVFICLNCECTSIFNHSFEASVTIIHNEINKHSYCFKVLRKGNFKVDLNLLL